MKNKFTLFDYLLMIGSLATLNSCKKEKPAPVPVASFSYYNDASNQGQINFTNTSTNATSYSWSFGVFSNPSSSTETSPSCTYSFNSNYSVSLTATGPGGSNTTTQTITVSNYTSGQNIFWTANSSYGNITVYVDGAYAGQFSYYSASGTAPDCGTAGFLTVSKSVGAHSFTASCSSGNWNGNFNIIGGFCSQMELN